MRSFHRIAIAFVILSSLAAGCGQRAAPTAVLPSAGSAEPATTDFPPKLPAATEGKTPTATRPEKTSTAAPLPEFSVEISTPSQSPQPGFLTGGLEGLDFDAFVEEAYRSLLLRTPQALTELGLSDAFGVRDDRLNDLSEDYLRQTQEMERDILEILNGYDRAQLAPEQQLTADILAWYLDDLVRGQAYAYRDFPVSFLITTGVQLQLLSLFVDLHPVKNIEDAQDYISRLSQVDDQFEQLAAGLRRRQAEGVVMPRFLFPWVAGDIRSIAESPAEATPFFITLKEKVNALPGLSPAEKDGLLAAALEQIETSVLPGYKSLAKVLADLEAAATDEVGVWKFQDGEAYYAYALRHHTTTDLTADEIHQMGLDELERIHAEMRAAFQALGYPEGESLPDLYNRLAEDGGFYRGAEIAAAYEDLIEEAEEKASPAFELRPRASVKVIAGEQGDYYIPPAADGSRPGLFYARVGGSEPRYKMPTLAYHEVIPGHHFQMALALEQPLPDFRKAGLFNSYLEGWALYAERLAAEMEFYQDDPYGNLGRLQAEAFRAARMVVDTGIHAKRWGFDQAVDFMVENTGLPREYVQGEVGRYVVWPGQATAYMVGMLKILELRQRAEDALGERFDLVEFHNVILKNGAVPLDVLEQIVDEYIAASQGP